ncbi:hypothetical protein ACQKMI_10590 [Lysinibacillus sp. NPDC097214]|uniref:hypothetical protein n=1 Tax=Lysinibacillus sp. NPDC097214 TaxID=3390584 RepID=UPI003D06C3D3
MKEMSVYKIFDAMYKHAITDEKLMRYLFYAAKHKDDDVTLVTSDRPNIIGGLNNQIYNNGINGENVTSFDIINQVVKMRKRNEKDLTADDPQCVLYFYLDNFENATSGTNNAIDPYSFLQLVNIDAYVHEDFQNTGFTLAKVVDRVIALFNQQHVGGIGNVNFAGSGKLDDVEGYEGMQIKFRNRYTTR